VTASLQSSLTGVFGFDALRPGQAAAIDDVLAGRPAVVVMPTGAGKSLCYQLPAVMLGTDGGVTLVVSPLIALMKDQVDALRARGVPAAALTSASDAATRADTLEGLRAGTFCLVYVAPERFRSPRFLDALAHLGDRLALLAIDEAHCISEWGHDFRPDYRRLGAIVRELAPPRLVALTATATPEVRDDIVAHLDMRDPALHIHGFDRPNLHYRVVRAGGAADKATRLTDLVRRRASGTALVYAATRKNTERYTAELATAGMRAAAYHAGLADEARRRAQDAFMDDELDVIVATNAFGMGIDKRDIHLVIHADLPGSVEAYYQESGRGGRDGARTDCVLLFNHADVRLHEFLIDAASPSAALLRTLWRTLREQPDAGDDLDRLRGHLPDAPHAATVDAAIRLLARHGFILTRARRIEAVTPEELSGEFPALDAEGPERRAAIERGKLRRMVEYGYLPRCRRQYMLEYFGDDQWRDRARRCDACDNCNGLGATRAIGDDERRQVDALLAVVGQLRGRFGRTRVAAVANGTDDDPRLAALPQRGALRGQSARSIMDLLRALEGAGLVTASRGDYPTISLTRQGRDVLSGRVEIESLGIAVTTSPRARPRRARAAAAAGPIDDAVAERLRTLRARLAAEHAVPPYVIFSNKTLGELARTRPASTSDLAAVHGIGPSRLERYGDNILAAVRGE